MLRYFAVYFGAAGLGHANSMYLAIFSSFIIVSNKYLKGGSLQTACSPN
jgi:hypothetical protein